MWQCAVMYHTRISSCCFLERQCFTDVLLERLLPRDGSECFRGSCLPGEGGDIGLQIRTKVHGKNRTMPNEWGHGHCLNSEILPVLGVSLNSKMHGWACPSPRFSGCLASDQRSCECGNTGPCLLHMAKYVCSPTLFAYHCRHENINSKHYIPLTSPELHCFFFSSSVLYHHILSQKKNF